MTFTPTEKPQPNLIFSHHERSQLLRLCTRLTGDPAAADDLVQETMITAWQRLEQLTDPDGLSAWLATIARNHYRHWVRSRSRQQQYVVTADETTINRVAITDIDLLAELDREQFVVLLDQAMAHLPAATQTLLVQHYLDEIPHPNRISRADGDQQWRSCRATAPWQGAVTTTPEHQI